MSVQLVIAEKPSVARSIAAVIGATEKQTGYWQGGGYLVSWCIGHLVSFAERLFRLPSSSARRCTPSWKA